MQLRIRLFVLALVMVQAISAQEFQPVFDGKEYTAFLSMMHFESSIPDKARREKEQDPYKLVYKSPEMGMKNLWWLYTNAYNQAVIVIRGTVGDKASWLENYYCPMIPATGSLQLDATTKFDYKLAESNEAYVHAGWTIGMAYLVRDMVPHIKELYQKGVRDFFIFGHSQGGVLSYLVSSYLYYQRQAGALPQDIRFKTYTSAAPKPGNMQYAYDFDFINKGGWAYSVVNAADWVPETPYSIQRVSDMNRLNPIIHIPDDLKKQKFFLRLVGNLYYGKLNRKTRKAQRSYTNILGHKLYKLAIKKVLPGLKEPQYMPSMSYMRAGTPVVLLPDAEYYKKYGTDGKDKFAHHHLEPYLYLLQKQYGK
ncbi:lipase family protein [Niabella beijingensis]|uniref:lipase family protein n=1 Tax=Niabella beijingensis TaxID=2872700 RepID=UPI001CC02BB6|nr:lipase family protein [Niabella beijingensis]MBZ4192108.1 lipase family protein [Niabella beijingensis]